MGTLPQRPCEVSAVVHLATEGRHAPRAVVPYALRVETPTQFHCARGSLRRRLHLVDEPDLSYVCHVQAFRPAQTRDARWLDIEADFAILQHFHESRGPFSWSDAVKWKESGFTDAGIIEAGVLVSRAALWTYSENAWELAGVFTVPTARGAGYSRSVCTFVTSAILKAGRVATCHAHPGNVAMRRLAESLGYKLIS